MRYVILRASVAISGFGWGHSCVLTLVAGSLFLWPRLAATADTDAPTPVASEIQNIQPDQGYDDPKLADHFSGRVTGPDGGPVAGARVYVAPYGVSDEEAVLAIKDPGPVRAQTDGEGRFEFDAPDMAIIDPDGLPTRRQCLVIAAADGYAPNWAQCRGRIHTGPWILEPIAGTDLSLRLAKDDVPLRGRLFDAQGRPLVGAQVRALALTIPPGRDLHDYLERRKSPLAGCPPVGQYLSRPHLLPGVSVETQTDASGSFTLMGLGRERVASLAISEPTIADTYLDAMTRAGADSESPPMAAEERPASGTHAAGFGLKLPPGRTVKGLVRDHDTHEPIPGMWVGPYNEPREGLISGRCRWMSDRAGRFTITGLHRVDPTQDARGELKLTAISQPGMLCDGAGAEASGDEEVVIDCRRGIPFRLKLVDEQGQGVEAEVTYWRIAPNPDWWTGLDSNSRWPDSRAARRVDGIYEGFVLPGPGAVFVRTPGRSDLRPAHVDPKAFFAPARTEWTAQEKISEYGTQESLSIGCCGIMQADYQAIVLVNPALGAAPLELSATVAKDRPRQITLVDPQGQPVVGAVTTGGLSAWPLRTASFPLTQLNPDRARRLTFTEEKRGLIGSLIARGDRDAPYTVRMQPWGALVGRILDERGAPAKTSLDSPDKIYGDTNDDPAIGIFEPRGTEEDGRFRIDHLVSGQRYSAEMWREYRYVGVAFENQVVAPGEIRDLGDIRSEPPVDVRSRSNGN